MQDAMHDPSLPSHSGPPSDDAPTMDEVGPTGLVWIREQSAGRGRLSIEDIVTTAVAMADAAGLETVSMRRVGAELGVTGMSLYTHVTRKDDLVALMIDWVMAESIIPPEELDIGWRDALAQIASRSYALYIEHPWVLSALGRQALIGPNRTRYYEQIFAAVAELSLDASVLRSICVAVELHAMGCALRGRLLDATMRTDRLTQQEWILSIEQWFGQLMATGEFPHFAKAQPWRVLHAAKPYQQEFLISMGWLLDGIAAGISQGTSPGPPGGSGPDGSGPDESLRNPG